MKKLTAIFALTGIFFMFVNISWGDQGLSPSSTSVDISKFQGYEGKYKRTDPLNSTSAFNAKGSICPLSITISLRWGPGAGQLKTRGTQWKDQVNKGWIEHASMGPAVRTREQFDGKILTSESERKTAIIGDWGQGLKEVWDFSNIPLMRFSSEDHYSDPSGLKVACVYERVQ